MFHLAASLLDRSARAIRAALALGNIVYQGVLAVGLTASRNGCSVEGCFFLARVSTPVTLPDRDRFHSGAGRRHLSRARYT